MLYWCDIRLHIEDWYSGSLHACWLGRIYIWNITISCRLAELEARKRRLMALKVCISILAVFSAHKLTLKHKTRTHCSKQHAVGYYRQAAYLKHWGNSHTAKVSQFRTVRCLRTAPLAVAVCFACVKCTGDEEMHTAFYLLHPVSVLIVPCKIYSGYILFVMGLIYKLLWTTGCWDWICLWQLYNWP